MFWMCRIESREYNMKLYFLDDIKIWHKESIINSDLSTDLEVLYHCDGV